MPLTPLSFTRTADPVEAKAWFAGLIEREPEAMSVVASVADSLVADPSRFVGPRWWAGRQADGEVVAAFMHTPPHLLHVGLATPDEAVDLAVALAGAGDGLPGAGDGLPGAAAALPGVGGPREPAQAFANAWARLTGARLTTSMEMGRYDLPTRPRLPFEVEGAMRVAGVDDLGLVQAWAAGFHAAVEPGRGNAPSLRGQVKAGRVALWEVAGRPVSMASASSANGGTTRISWVWTPPERRGHGYASAVVAALSRARMDAGERCLLFTDLANPTSNAIYQALGYRRVGDSVAIDFS